MKSAIIRSGRIPLVFSSDRCEAKQITSRACYFSQRAVAFSNTMIGSSLPFNSQDVNAPWYYYFLSPGFQETHIYNPVITVGTTYDSDSVSTPPSPKPASLVVLSIQTLPTGTGVDHGCAPDQDYGIEVAIRYQVIGDDGQPLQKANMRPQERVTNSVVNGESQPDPKPNRGDIGPTTRNSQTSRFTDASGQFVDAPFGSCARGPYTHTEKQEISILVGSKRYPMRTNNITESSSAEGAGSTSNGSDIQKSRP